GALPARAGADAAAQVVARGDAHVPCGAAIERGGAVGAVALIDAADQLGAVALLRSEGARLRRVAVVEALAHVAAIRPRVGHALDGALGNAAVLAAGELRIGDVGNAARAVR